MEDPSFEAQWRRRFNEFAETQDTDASIAGWSETGLETRVRGFVHRWTPRSAGERWLDLGCGAGTYTRLLAEQRLSVVGVDYSPRSLVKAQARSPKSIPWVSADARRLPFASGSFDGILCFGVTQALSETLSIATEAARVLRGGGELWIDALNSACIANVISTGRRRIRGLPNHLRYEKVSGIRRSLVQAGLEPIDIYWLPLTPSRLVMLQRALESRFALALFRALPVIGSLLSHSFVVRARRQLPTRAPPQ